MPAKRRLWIGRIISVFCVLFLVFDGVTKVLRLTPIMEATARLGYPVSFAAGIGVLLLVCTLLYVILRTSVLGAILLTGYLGGATASQVRIGGPSWFSIVFGCWCGRDCTCAKTGCAH
jgi:DoxX-like family